MTQQLARDCMAYYHYNTLPPFVATLSLQYALSLNSTHPPPPRFRQNMYFLLTAILFGRMAALLVVYKRKLALLVLSNLHLQW